MAARAEDSFLAFQIDTDFLGDPRPLRRSPPPSAEDESARRNDGGGAVSAIATAPHSPEGPTPGAKPANDQNDVSRLGQQLGASLDASARQSASASASGVSVAALPPAVPTAGYGNSALLANV